MRALFAAVIALLLVSGASAAYYVDSYGRINYYAGAVQQQAYAPYSSDEARSWEQGFQKGLWQGGYDRYFGFGFDDDTQDILYDPQAPLRNQNTIYDVNDRPLYVRVVSDNPYEGIAYKTGYGLGYYEGYYGRQHPSMARYSRYDSRYDRYDDRYENRYRNYDAYDRYGSQYGPYRYTQPYGSYDDHYWQYR